MEECIEDNGNGDVRKGGKESEKVVGEVNEDDRERNNGGVKNGEKKNGDTENGEKKNGDTENGGVGETKLKGEETTEVLISFDSGQEASAARGAHNDTPASSHPTTPTPHDKNDLEISDTRLPSIDPLEPSITSQDSSPSTSPSTLQNSTSTISPIHPTNEKSSKADDVLTSRLREVFDVCDNQSQGFISVDHFLGLAKEFASSDKHTDDEVIKRMVSALDSDASGKISFDDFCKGVKHILLSNKSVLKNGDIDQRAIQDFLNVRKLSVDGQMQSPEIFETSSTPSLLTPDDNNNINTNNNNNNNNNNKNNNNTSNNKSSFDFVAGEKAPSNSSEDDVDSGAWSSVTQDNFWLNTPSKTARSTLDATPSPLSNGFPSNDLLGNGFSSFPSNSVHDNGDFEDRSSNYFHRKVHSNNTTPRSSFRSSPGSRHGSFRKLGAPSSLASQSYKASSTVNCSDLLLDVADSQVCELSDKILKLEDNLSSLNEIQKENEDKHLKMKEENALMVERVHVLEDQLREIESMNQERLQQQQHKHKEIMMKSEKDKANQIELLSRSLKLIENEYNALKESTPALKAENEKLKKQVNSLDNEVSRTREECVELEAEKAKLQESLDAEQASIKKERQVRTQLLDDLTQELNELRICKSNLMRSSPAGSRRHGDAESLHRQEQVKHLKKENADLKCQLEELQVAVLSRGMEEGQRLLQHKTSFEKSLAHEIDEIPRDELVIALQKEREVNRELKEYISFITLRILERNPSLLEKTEAAS